MVGRLTAAALLLIGVLVGPGSARAQKADAVLKDRVAQLVAQLDADEVAARDEAERVLIRLGPRALPLLPEAGALRGAEQILRLERVRLALEEARSKAAVATSRVTLQGQGLRLTEAIQALQTQSGNTITDIREQNGEEVTNPALDLDLKDAPFFEALDALCSKARLTPYFYTGDGSIGLVSAPAEPAGDGPKTVYPGPFRVQLLDVVAKRDFASGLDTANVHFQVAWEPRLRPMLLELVAGEVRVADDRGQPVAPAVPMEELSIPLRDENPVAELNLNLAAPERAAKSLDLKVKASVTMPGGQRHYRFPDLTKPGKQTQGDVTVELVSTEVEDFVWKVRLVVNYPGGVGPAFESYRQGLFHTRIWLQKPDGSRFEHNGGFSDLGSAEGRLGFEYLFVDAPGKPADYGLVYEAPGAIVAAPLEFEFKDVPLP